MMRARWWLNNPVLLLALGCGAAGGGDETPPVDLVPPAAAGGAGSGDVSAAGSNGEVVENPDTPVEPNDPMAECPSSLPGAPALRRLTRREVENTLRDAFPVLGDAWRSTLSADTVSSSGFDNDTGQLLVSKQTARELADTAESVGGAVATNIAQLLPCAAASPDASCAGQHLDSAGRRLFRRPLSDAERAAYLAFFDTALTTTGDFAQAIGWLTRALVESPSFVYRREIGAAQGGVQQLDQYEIATELAYTFSGTGPSVALLDRAQRGELGSPEVLEDTARELLASPRGREVIQSFFEAYVGHSRVTSIAKEGVQEFASLREQ
ncbi:MAG TPA: DUF1592 domain-containing protein, partial [Polyangiaceae bacterium]|nr:DUF1592 domain-containing protein [Polyangiaceae bacterium]